MTVYELIKELQSVDPNKEVKIRISAPEISISKGVDWVQENKESVSLHWQYKFDDQ